MKIIIAGSRHAPFEIYHVLPKIIELSGFNITEVVCGMARGMDTWGRKWAVLNGVAVKDFPADWKNEGKAAGPVRNMQMGDYADGLIAAIWDGSRGTAHMIRYMEQLRKPAFIVYDWDKSQPDVIHQWKPS